MKKIKENAARLKISNTTFGKKKMELAFEPLRRVYTLVRSFGYVFKRDPDVPRTTKNPGDTDLLITKPMAEGKMKVKVWDPDLGGVRLYINDNMYSDDAFYKEIERLVAPEVAARALPLAPKPKQKRKASDAKEPDARKKQKNRGDNADAN